MIQFILIGMVRQLSEVDGVAITDFVEARFDCVYDSKAKKAYYLRADGTHPNEVPSERIGPNLQKALEAV